jgi:penicillin-binding protein 1A
MSDIQQSTALGGITRGVSNLEMTAAFAAIANGGLYTEPILYTQVLDKEGNILLDNTSPATHQVIKDSTAALLTSAMKDVITSGTGTAAKLSNMPAAGKTGTSEHSMDLWLSAYTPYYTASVWTGFDSSNPMENKYSSESWHSAMWGKIMTRIHADLPYKDFTVPTSVQQKSICTKTGLLATSSCTALTELFSTNTIPSQSCPGHQVKVAEEDEEDKEKEDSDSDSSSNSGFSFTLPGFSNSSQDD